MSLAGVGILDYARGAGGRVLDLPREYQDAIASALRTVHPKTIPRRIQLVMASDGYLRSSHRQIRGFGDAELREFHRQLARKVGTRGAG